MKVLVSLQQDDYYSMSVHKVRLIPDDYDVQAERKLFGEAVQRELDMAAALTANLTKKGKLRASVADSIRRRMSWDDYLEKKFPAVPFEEDC